MTAKIVDLFEANRAQLRAKAARMLGSSAEAEDAVQQAWLHVERSGTEGVENFPGWLTTIVARICLDMLRARKSRREDTENLLDAPGDASPERDALLADSLGTALQLILDTLAPAERVAFVLHDMFDLAFDDIAQILQRTPEATRQLASRARRRVQVAKDEPLSVGSAQAAVVAKFLSASRNADLPALLAVLAPNIVARVDQTAIDAAKNAGAAAPKFLPETRGKEPVAKTLLGRARGAQLALVDGIVQAVWAPGGKTRALFLFTVANGEVAELQIIADPARIAASTIAVL